jgi:hypothetical protein
MFSYDHLASTVICYKGPINIDLVSFISNYLKQHINANNVVVSRIYKVLIELIQNVSYYSVDQFSNRRSFGTGIGWFRVEENENWFSVSTGNRILKEHGPVLVRNSHEINSLKEDDLRALKRKTRGQASQRDIGAHIGLIQTGLLSGNTLDLTVDPIDDKYSYYTITAKINKS